MKNKSSQNNTGKGSHFSAVPVCGLLAAIAFSCISTMVLAWELLVSGLPAMATFLGGTIVVMSWILSFMVDRHLLGRKKLTKDQSQMIWLIALGIIVGLFVMFLIGRLM